MTWFTFAVLAALAGSLLDICSKRASRSVHPLIVSWAWTLLSLPVLIPLALQAGLPEIGSSYGPALIAATILFTVNSILYVKAISVSDLSLTVPIANFTPIFILFLTGPLILSESPTWAGLAGVGLIVFGTYTLNTSDTNKGFFAPFKAAMRQSGPRWMLLVAFSFSITAPIEKIGILDSSPLFWAATQHTAVALVMLPVLVWRREPGLAQQLRSRFPLLLLIGVIVAFAVIFQTTALAHGPVAYVIAIKRCGILLSVFVGWHFFGEGSFKRRLAGTVIMLAGVAVIATQ